MWTGDGVRMKLLQVITGSPRPGPAARFIAPFLTSILGGSFFGDGGAQIVYANYYWGAVDLVIGSLVLWLAGVQLKQAIVGFGADIVMASRLFEEVDRDDSAT
jgi:hypothetical protein